MRRIAALLLSIAALAGSPALQADEPRVRAMLTLVDGRTTFVSGEPILVDLDLEAVDEPVAMLSSAGADEFELDTVEIAPTTGIHPWRTDMETYERRNGGDVVPFRPLGKSLHRRVSVDARYRFDVTGTYAVRVVTRRAGSVETNTVTFTIEQPSVAIRQERAAEALDAFRNATSDRQRRLIAARLDRYSDDAATDAKLALLIGADRSRRYVPMAAEGLWIARDRARIVQAFETAATDPAQDPVVLGTLFEIVADLEASLAFPYDGPRSTPTLGPSMIYPNGPHWPLRAQLHAGLLRRLASTLPKRTGRSQAQAAQVIVSDLGAFDFALPSQRSTALMQDPDFLAAREILITHHDEEDPQWLPARLDRDASFYEDPRMIATLHRALDTSGRPLDEQQRSAAMRLLAKLEPSSTMVSVVREACARQPVDVRTFASASATTSEVIDACLARKLDEETAPEATRTVAARTDISTMAYVARFASPALVPVVDRIYRTMRGDRRHWAAPGAALAYLVRCDPDRYRSELARAADANDTMLMFQLVHNSQPHAPGLRSFLRERIALPPVRETSGYVYALWQLNEAGDEVFLRERLAALRSEAGASPEKVSTENEIETALKRGMGRGPQT